MNNTEFKDSSNRRVISSHLTDLFVLCSISGLQATIFQDDGDDSTRGSVCLSISLDK